MLETKASCTFRLLLLAIMNDRMLGILLIIILSVVSEDFLTFMLIYLFSFTGGYYGSAGPQKPG